MGNRSHIAIQEFKEINWLPVRARFEQNVTTHIVKELKIRSTQFTSADLCNIKTRTSSYKLILPHCTKASGHNTISSLGPRLWNKLPSDIKHKVKMHFFEVLEKETDDRFFYY